MKKAPPRTRPWQYKSRGRKPQNRSTPELESPGAQRPDLYCWIYIAGAQVLPGPFERRPSSNTSHAAPDKTAVPHFWPTWKGAGVWPMQLWTAAGNPMLNCRGQRARHGLGTSQNQPNAAGARVEVCGCGGGPKIQPTIGRGWLALGCGWNCETAT